MGQWWGQEVGVWRKWGDEEPVGPDAHGRLLTGPHPTPHIPHPTPGPGKRRRRVPTAASTGSAFWVLGAVLGAYQLVSSSSNRDGGGPHYLLHFIDKGKVIAASHANTPSSPQLARGPAARVWGAVVIPIAQRRKERPPSQTCSHAAPDNRRCFQGHFLPQIPARRQRQTHAWDTELSSQPNDAAHIIEGCLCAGMALSN